MSAPTKAELIEEYAGQIGATDEDLQEFVSSYLPKITIITKYDGNTADTYVAAVARPLSEITPERRRDLRIAFDCDGEGETPEDDDDLSNLFFREAEGRSSPSTFKRTTC